MIQCASKRRVRRTRCENKKAYQSQRQADDVADAMIRSGLGMGLRGYECPFCGRFHVGRRGIRGGGDEFGMRKDYR